jgi:hypothetical protein
MSGANLPEPGAAPPAPARLPPNRWGLASLVCAMTGLVLTGGGMAVGLFLKDGFLTFGLGFLALIAAVVCGHVGLRRARRSPASPGGRRLAIAGLAVGYALLLLWPILIAVALGLFLWLAVQWRGA